MDFAFLSVCLFFTRLEKNKKVMQDDEKDFVETLLIGSVLEPQIDELKISIL